MPTLKHTLASLILACAWLAAVAQPADFERERERQGRSPSEAPTNSATSPSSPAQSPTAAEAAAPATNAMGGLPLSQYLQDDKHKLIPGDRIGFRILEDRTNSIPMLVAESSELEIPYIGRVSVAGMTCKQAADDIKARLEKDYYFKATVVIGLDALATRTLGKVYISGPVRVPGAIEIPPSENFTISKAILRAGGFGDFANRKKVQIIRKTESGNRTFLVNLENVLEKGRTEEDVSLEPEDLIIVPQRSVNW